MEFGRTLRELRHRRGITQEELARQINVTRDVIAGYETKRYNPPYETLKKIADYFGVSMNHLLTGGDGRK